MLIPKLDILIPLVGITSGTLCAFVFPPLLETIVFWRIWKRRNELWYIFAYFFIEKLHTSGTNSAVISFLFFLACSLSLRV